VCKTPLAEVFFFLGNGARKDLIAYDGAVMNGARELVGV
jgi:hypothetical protein